MPEHREKSQLLGDFLREMAVLMVVLYPLEAYLLNRFDWWIFVLVVLLAAALLYWGMILEGRDEL